MIYPPSSDFTSDIKLCEKSKPIQDWLYKKIFIGAQVCRFEQDNERHILDEKFHIDVVLKLSNGIVLTGQEKALRYKYSEYNTFTIEFYQDREKKIKGEFFNMGAQFYNHSYWNTTKDKFFVKGRIIKCFEFFDWLRDKSIKDLEKDTRSTGGSRASFLKIKYDDLPKGCIFAEWDFTKVDGNNKIVVYHTESNVTQTFGF